MWLSSKGGNEFLTTSTDGTIKWWDIWNFSQTTDHISIRESLTDNKNIVIGGTCLEYVAEYGPKYLIGTELGSIVLVTKKPKKAVEINYNNCYGIENNSWHFGAINSIKRNPFYPRFFASFGDWCVNVK